MYSAFLNYWHHNKSEDLLFKFVQSLFETWVTLSRSPYAISSDRLWLVSAENTCLLWLTQLLWPLLDPFRIWLCFSVFESWDSDGLCLFILTLLLGEYQWDNITDSLSLPCNASDFVGNRSQGKRQQAECVPRSAGWGKEKEELFKSQRATHTLPHPLHLSSLTGLCRWKLGNVCSTQMCEAAAERHWGQNSRT